MKSIQIDSFEVQLGAGMLLQFRHENETITILADAGVQSSGYAPEHVLDKLPAAFDDFLSGNRRIDLIIGTHYDADHLRGLVPIINDQNIEIGEIWLPPVADDQAPNATGTAILEEQFLGLKWLNDESGNLAKSYLATCSEQCDTLRTLELEALQNVGEIKGQSWSPRLRTGTIDKSLDLSFDQEASFSSIRNYFEWHLHDCDDLPGDEGCHCHADIDVTDVSIGSELSDDYRFGVRHLDSNLLNIFHYGHTDYIKHLWTDAPNIAATHSLSLARLRKSTAQGAITATYLAQVVEAIRNRMPRISIKHQVIPDGKPVKLRWDNQNRKFLSGATVVQGAPAITLLGPSERLVQKHRDKLPVLEEMNLALFSKVPIKSITPSNQLSYILRIDHDDQGILVTGDAGCVDHMNAATGKYYPDLVKNFAPLHIVQVAHHGGNNAHFYNVLLESGFKSQENAAFLILSHATDDKHRPSEVFARFIGELPDSRRPSLLFTSRPSLSKVEGFEGIIHQAVGPASETGDVRVSFDNGSWTVEAHAVQIP